MVPGSEVGHGDHVDGVIHPPVRRASPQPVDLLGLTYNSMGGPVEEAKRSRLAKRRASPTSPLTMAATTGGSNISGDGRRRLPPRPG